MRRGVHRPNRRGNREGRRPRPRRVSEDEEQNNRDEHDSRPPGYVAPLPPPPPPHRAQRRPRTRGSRARIGTNASRQNQNHLRTISGMSHIVPHQTKSTEHHWKRLRKKHAMLALVNADALKEKDDKEDGFLLGAAASVMSIVREVASAVTFGAVKSGSTLQREKMRDENAPDANEKDDFLMDGYSNVAGYKDGGDDDEDPEDSRNVWSIDAFEPTPDRVYLTKLAAAFLPFMRIATIFGRFPLTHTTKKDGNLIFRFNYRSFPGITFIFVSIFTFLLFILVFVNIVGLMIKFPRSPDVGSKRSQLVRSEEIAILKRNFVPFSIFLLNMIHLVLAQAAFFFKREYIARYFGYWGEVVELLRLDIAEKLRWEMRRKMVLLMTMFAFVIGIHLSDCFSACNGGAAVITILLTRCFDPAIHQREDFYKFRYLGVAIFSYIYISSKFYMVYFFFRCRLLKNMLIVWNKRFDICVNGTREKARTVVRCNRAYLFKDHIVTLNLMEGANHEFVLILESYLVTAMIGMVLELYHAGRSIGGSEFNENRQLDFIVLMSYLVFDFYIFFTSCLEGGYIPEQAKTSFDIVKRKGMMSNRADHELWFMLSMRISLDGCSGEQGVGITAGNFVYITKTFILIAIGLMTSHFIIVYQFEMPLQQTAVSDPNFPNVNLTDLVERVEGTRNLFNLDL